MKLNIRERGQCLALLPSKGNFTTLKIVHEAQMTLSLSEQEHKDFEVTITSDGKGGQLYQFNEKGNEPKELTLGPTAIQLIRDKLLELDKQELLVHDQYDLYIKFVGEPKEA